MTRHHARLFRAYALLVEAHLRLSLRHNMPGGAVRTLDSWCVATFGVSYVWMSGRQLRTARRRLNAWRASIEGRK